MRPFILLLLGCLLAGCFTPTKNPRIEITEQEIQRRIVVTNIALNINSMTATSWHGQETISVGGGGGAAFIDRNYRPLQLVRFFDVHLRTTVPVDINRDGVYEYMDRGGGWQPVKLVSSEGRLLWEFPDRKSGLAADQMAAGDLDRDGHVDFAVGMNAAGGLYLFNSDGTVKWRREAGNVFAVEIVDVDGDGQPEIVHIDGGRIVIRDKRGEIIRQFQFPSHPVDHLVWKLDHNEFRVVGTRDGFIHIYDLQGKELRRVRLPRVEGYVASLRPIRHAGAVYYAASIHAPYHYNNGYFYIFDEAGRVLHKEIFATRLGGLLVLPNPAHQDSDVLLVGVGSQVIEYQMK